MRESAVGVGSWNECDGMLLYDHVLDVLNSVSHSLQFLHTILLLRRLSGPSCCVQNAIKCVNTLD